MQERFYSFNRYLRDKFGQRVQKISLDAGFGCPNIDGNLSTDGCVYCNNKGFGKYARLGKSVEEQIEDSITFYGQRLGVKKFIAYFQSFTNTYADLEILKEKYDLIRKYPQIVALFISTRPDCINEEKIKLIADYQEDYLVWIEYGLQTTHNRILNLINRNHTYEDFLSALDLTRRYKINVGIHLILGLPSLTYGDMLVDIERIASLDIQGIKFHVLHVLKDTKLEELYRKGEINLLSQKEYIGIICDFLERLPKSLVILRLVSSALGDYLIAPLWMNDKHRVLEGIRKELEKRGTYQGYYAPLALKRQ